MSTLFTRFQSVLLAGVVASSILAIAQTQTAPAASKSTVKKTAPAAARKTTATTATKSAATPALTTEKDKLSYVLGADMGKRLKDASIDVDAKIMARGISDALNGAKAAMTDDEIRATMTNFQQALQQKQAAAIKDMSDKNRKEGEEFLAQNKTKEGVVTLPSGLEYKILKAGDGPKPTATDKVKCSYRGTLLNGKEFDSSYKRNEPVTFPVNGVIKGWTEALQLMPVGSKWQLFIPPDLAYGERGAGNDIEPNSTLVFEVELVSIEAKDKSAEAK
jgi:FKBP-type peptidyl-prolyl cis-trans isomerase